MKVSKLLVCLKIFREFIAYLNKHPVIGFTLAFGISVSLIVWSLSSNADNIVKVVETIKSLF